MNAEREMTLDELMSKLPSTHRAKQEFVRMKTDANRYRWLLTDADHATSLVNDTYTDWDTDKDWKMELNTAIDSMKERESEAYY